MELCDEKTLAVEIGSVYSEGMPPRRLLDDLCEGSQEAGAPWREPAKLPSLNLKGMGGLGRSMDAFAGDFKV